MSRLEVALGPLDVDAIRRMHLDVAESDFPDPPSSIQLARAARLSTNSLDSDVSLTWTLSGSIIAYTALCLHRCGDGPLTLQGLPFPLRLPTVAAGLDRNVHRAIMENFRDHILSLLVRTDSAAASVWASVGRKLARGSLEARWLAEVPTKGAGMLLEVSLDTSSGVYWSGLRKSYRSLINKGQREFATTTVGAPIEGSLGADSAVEVMAHLHESAAGRKVYDDRLWEVIKAQIYLGQAACTIVELGALPIGALILLLDRDRNRASYAMGAFDRDAMGTGLPVGHTALWAGTQWLRENGFTSLTMGNVTTPSQTVGKEAGIDRFKHGFANALVPCLVTEIRLGSRDLEESGPPASDLLH